MPDDRPELKILVVDDHDSVIPAVLGVHDDRPDVPLPPVGTNLKWIRSPETARRFLQQISDHGWRPDFALVDFHFGASALTGLGVLQALAEQSPETTSAIFSGHDANSGRALFVAAAHHWFGVEYDVSKAESRRSASGLISESEAARPRVTVRVQRHAHLIDAFFTNPTRTPLLFSWDATLGETAAMMSLHPGLTRDRATTYKTDLAQIAAAFDAKHSAELALPADASSYQEQNYLRHFMARNRAFFNDPAVRDYVLARTFKRPRGA